MTEAAFTYSTRTFNDVTEQEIAFPGWQQRYTQLGKGRYSGRVVCLTLAGVSIIQESVGKVLEVESCPPEGTFVVGIPVGNSRGRMNGVSINHRIACQRGGTGIDVLQDGTDVVIAVQIDSGMLHESSELPAHGLVPVDRASPMGELAAWLKALLALFPTRALDFSPDLLKRISRLVVDRVSEALDVLRSDKSCTRLTYSQSYDLYRRVRSALEQEDLCDHSVALIAERIAVPDFVIRAAFHEVLGIPPRLWLRQRRLAAAHRVLRHTRVDKTIAEIALDHGFAHYSRFSQYYSETYGQLPSRARY